MDGKTTIKKNVQKWTAKNLHETFEFHEYQLENIVDIIYNILHPRSAGHENYIIEAPTGSGKSILCIIAAGVLHEYYHMRSYILCSDLYLWQQYREFIDKNNLDDFGYIKGQSGNYKCMVNHEDIRNADCKVRGLNWATVLNNKKAKKLGYRCAEFCEYANERRRALNAGICVITYQLLLYYRNVKNMQYGFDTRDVMFCDECHNIPSIIQNKYSPVINNDTIGILKSLYYYDSKELKRNKKSNSSDTTGMIYNIYSSADDITKAFVRLFNVMKKDEQHKTKIYKEINDFDNFFKGFNDLTAYLETQVAKRKEADKERADDLMVYKTCSHYHNLMCHWNDFLTAINATGVNCLIKQVEYDETHKANVTYNCTKEDYMISQYLLRHATHRIMLSATVGDKLSFDKNMGIRYTDSQSSKMSKIPSTFDFSKSPIYVHTKYKMSYRERSYSFEHLKPIVFDIIDKFKNEHGIIHTGSYFNAKQIYDSAPDKIKQRLLIYGNAHEKADAIEQHKKRKDTIIISPTLLEGIDLPGDLCRFIIILKVPYPSLASNLVKAKMRMFPGWYASTTSNLIIQGIGRGNRSKDDYCSTYILDACFTALYKQTRQQYPVDIQKRIKLIG